jgi:hypothetical protein
MSFADRVCETMRNFSACRDLGNGDVQVTTHCLYPSNAVVQVTVRSVIGGCFVSDEGGASSETVTAGIELSKSAQARYAQVARKQGLNFFGGVVSAPYVDLQAVPMAVMLVANVSKEIADQIFQHHRVRRGRDFRQLVTSLLRVDLKQSPREELIAGQSTRTYRFENVFTLPSGRRALVDPVLRDPNSINARVIANLDVHAAANESIAQRIIYDDEDDWETDDLNVLHMTSVPVVPFSKADKAIKDLLRA